LSIGAGDDRWLVRCFAGCDRRDLLAAVELRFDDLLYQSEAYGMGGEYTSPVQAALVSTALGSRAVTRLAALGIDPHGAGVEWAPEGRCRVEWHGHPRELPDVRALKAYGMPRQLGKVELCRWRELLDYEAGLVDPPAGRGRVAGGRVDGGAAGSDCARSARRAA
jgi:hypothetical protein